MSIERAVVLILLVLLVIFVIWFLLRVTGVT